VFATQNIINKINTQNNLILHLFIGMFQKAIMQSGCVFNPWALNEKHSKDAALLLAKKFGCEEDDPKNIIQYLLNIPAIDLVKFSTTKISFEVCIIN